MRRLEELDDDERGLRKLEKVEESVGKRERRKFESVRKAGTMGRLRNMEIVLKAFLLCLFAMLEIFVCYHRDIGLKQRKLLQGISIMEALRLLAEKH